MYNYQSKPQHCPTKDMDNKVISTIRGPILQEAIHLSFVQNYTLKESQNINSQKIIKLFVYKIKEICDQGASKPNVDSYIASKNLQLEIHDPPVFSYVQNNII